MNLEVEWFGHRKCDIWNLLKVRLIFFPLQCVPGPCWSFLTEPLRSFHPPKVLNWQLAGPRLQPRATPRMSLPGQSLWSCVASSPDLAKLGGGRSDLSGSIPPCVCFSWPMQSSVASWWRHATPRLCQWVMLLSTSASSSESESRGSLHLSSYLVSLNAAVVINRFSQTSGI